jgi:hypothetical protein
MEGEVPIQRQAVGDTNSFVEYLMNIEEQFNNIHVLVFSIRKKKKEKCC